MRQAEFTYSRVILSLCDYTGTWPEPYREAGYQVKQVDIKRGQDVRLMEHPGNVHGILAAPPCTMFAVSGARWRAEEKEQGIYEDKIKDALALVDACLRFVATCDPAWWALENPVGTLHQWLGEPAMYFNPCDYGDPYTKKTCLWGDFTRPEKDPVEPTEGSKMWSNYGGKSEATKTARSTTPKGFARAFFKANP